MKRLPHTRLTRRFRRRGISSAALLLSFTAILALLALGIDLGLLVQRHQQLKTASEAAALAAAHELFDPRLVDDRVDREQLARQAALNFAAANVLSDRPLKLELNRTNDPKGDVVLGWMNPPELLGKFTPRSKQQPLANAFLVRTRHSQTGRTGPLLTLGRMVGVTPHNLRTESIAAVDRRLVGFRPVACTNVPLLPLLIDSRQWGQADGDEEDAGPENGRSSGDDETEDETRPVQATEMDQYTVDPRTGVVIPGGDGYPEILITIGSRKPAKEKGEKEKNDRSQGKDDEDGASKGGKPQGPDSLPGWFIDFTGEELPVALPHEIQWGLAALDLKSAGGEIGLGSPVVCLSLNGAAARDVDLADVHESLLAIIGQPRVFALGSVNAGDGQVNGEVKNFAAGVVIESQMGSNWLTILVQPVVLNSCTAIVKAGVDPPNPWIGKVLLIR